MSTKKNDFVEHKNFMPSKISDETMNDLRNHHFSLGDWDPYKQSITHENYPEKPLPQNMKENKQRLTNKMRKHNFKIGDGKSSFPNTSYGRQFKAIPPNAIEKGLSKEELKQKVINLRNTNMILGQDRPVQVSTMRDAYKKLQMEPIKLNRTALQKTHFSLGNDVNDMQSVNRMTYKAKWAPGHNNEEKEKLMADLRSKFSKKKGSIFNPPRSSLEPWRRQLRLCFSKQEGLYSTPRCQTI